MKGYSFTNQHKITEYKRQKNQQGADNQATKKEKKEEMLQSPSIFLELDSIKRENGAQMCFIFTPG